MKAVIIKKYGGPEVARVGNVPTPGIHKANQILVKVLASSVNSGDARIRRADPWFVRLMFGLFVPRRKVLGIVFAGVVESIGESVKEYAVGDRVYGMNDMSMGGHAQYIILNSTTAMGKMPNSMSFTDAAALPFGGTTALYFLEGIDLGSKTVFINGVSGAVGLCFLQIAIQRGAHVTGVTSTENMKLVRELGADSVIDYTGTDIYSTAVEYDVAIDCINSIPVSHIKRFVKKGGVVVFLSGLVKEMFQSLALKKARVRIGSAKASSAQIDEISRLYEAGLLRPVINKTFSMSEIVEAYRLVDSGRKVGSVVIEISH